ncbi:MAG: insulinase family protein [Candidatus Eisenbacteria bacterium]|nr:insulinase family protein [Candidatus Eisenbacteria bacterium]
MICSRFVIAGVALALLFAVSGALGAGGGEEPGGFAGLENQVREFTLPNGLTFLVLERREVPVFAFRTYVDAGSVDEVAGVTGIAHMFEHMAFKGTPHIGTTDFPSEKESLAKVDRAWADLLAERRKRHRADSTRIRELETLFKAAQEEAGRYVVSNDFGSILEQEGANGLNAGTGFDATEFYYDLPSNKLELWAMMEGDRLANPVLREFYKERDVVIEERRMRIESSPSGRLVEELLQTAFVAHPYGNGLVGHRSDLESFTREEAEEFYRRHYVAKNMTIALVGDVDFATVQKLARKYFSGIPDAPVPPPVDTVEPPQKAEKRLVMEDEAQPMAFLAYHMPDRNDRRYQAYLALADILGRGRSSRLYTGLVKEDRVAVEAGSFASLPGEKYPSILFVYTVPAPGTDPDSVVSAFDRRVGGLLRERPVTQEELDGYKTRARARFWREIQSNQGMAGQLAYYQMMTGDWRNLFKQIDQVNAVRVEDVMKAARESLREENRTVAVLRQKSAS